MTALRLLPLLAALAGGCSSVNLGLSVPVGPHTGVGISVGSDGRVGVGVSVGVGPVGVSSSGQLPVKKEDETAPVKQP
jgi:hypothetical protein